MRKRYILCALCALTIGLCMTAVLVACRGGSGEETSAGSTTGSDEPIGEFHGAGGQRDGCRRIRDRNRCAAGRWDRRSL